MCILGTEPESCLLEVGGQDGTPCKQVLKNQRTELAGAVQRQRSEVQGDSPCPPVCSQLGLYETLPPTKPNKQTQTANGKEERMREGKGACESERQTQTANEAVRGRCAPPPFQAEKPVYSKDKLDSLLFMVKPLFLTDWAVLHL